MSFLELVSLSKSFGKSALFSSQAPSLAVSNVTLSIKPGETLGIVGESGSGKSTILRMILRLAKPTTGKILFKGSDVWAASGTDLFAMRREIQAIFQDPA